MVDEGTLAALGAIPSGIFILTAQHGDQETGMLASWVMQAGFDPPSVSVAVQRDRYIAEWLGEGCPFVLNVVADGDGTLLKHFGRGFEPGEPAFTDVPLRRTAQGVVILEDALAHLECVAGASVETGDHRVFVGEVVGGARTDGEPRLHVRKTGAHY